MIRIVLGIGGFVVLSLALLHLSADSARLLLIVWALGIGTLLLWTLGRTSPYAVQNSRWGDQQLPSTPPSTQISPYQRARQHDVDIAELGDDDRAQMQHDGFDWP